MQTYTIADLPPSIVREAFASLCAQLPRSATDAPGNRAAREDAAMAAVVALDPADAFEVKLAVRVIATDAHADDSLRSAAAALDEQEARRCRAQAGMMIRHSHSAMRALERRQATRDKALAAMHPAAMGRAGYWFKDVSVPAPDEAEPPPDAAVPPAPGQQADRFSALTEAEQYAVLYPKRAARIRAHGGLPPDLDFGPPEPQIVAGVVNGTSPILLELDPDETSSHATAS